MSLESAIRSPSMSSTGNVPRRENAIARGPPGNSERRTCGMRLKSSAQRAFSLKFEKLYCQRTGLDTAQAILLGLAPRAALQGTSGYPLGTAASCVDASAPADAGRAPLTPTLVAERQSGAVDLLHSTDLVRNDFCSHCRSSPRSGFLRLIRLKAGHLASFTILALGSLLGVEAAVRFPA